MVLTSDDEIGDRENQGAPQHALDRCPVCNYSLRGLPAAHRCPECGLEYDEHSIIWYPPRRRRWYAAFFALVSLGITGAGIEGIFLFEGTTADFWIGMGAVAFGILGFVLAVRGFLTRPFVAVVPLGVIVRMRAQAVEVIPWDQAGSLEVRERPPSGGTSTGSKKPRAYLTLGDIIVDAEDAKELCEAIQEGKERYAGQSTA
jgi:hypothetical protein